MKISKFYIFIALGLSASALAQKEDDAIGTEVVNVVKPYTPTISDAFKIKETPAQEDPDNAPRENIDYTIFSFPVASTFTPSKGRAAGVERSKREELFQNYASLAAGNYGTILGELYVAQEVGNSGYFSGMLRHHSSAGNIKDTELDDDFMNTSIDLSYGNKTKTFSWNADAGYQYQGYNWYGLPEGFGSNLIDADRKLLIGSIDPGHTYHNGYAGARISMGDSFFDEASIKFNRFWDTFDAAENRLIFKPRFGFDLLDTNIKLNAIADYLGGSFDAGPGAQFDYAFANFGVHPSVTFQGDDWQVEMGAAAFYSINMEGDESKFFIYPKVTASYKVVGDLMIFYAGADGDLEQNSYRDFTNQNPFMASFLGIAPTDKQFDVFAGLKGRLASNISYNLRASFMNEHDRALIRATDYNTNILNLDYQYGNSFGVVYDDMTTLGIFGELKADFSKNVSFGVNGTFNTYSTDNQPEAWNLPQIKLGSSLEVNITQKWYAGAQVFFVGERKDFQTNLDLPVPNDKVYTLDSYFDANAHVGYKHNNRLTGFVRANNIANQTYARWLNHNVQGFQFLLGASYKFNF